MIACTTNNSNGRLGNQVMRVMSLIGLAKENNCDWYIPKWKYAPYFEGLSINEMPKNIKFKSIKEPHYHYTPEFYSASLSDNGAIDIYGYLQSYKYWDEKLKFTESFKSLCKEQLGNVNNPIAISIRRGDFVNNPNYFQLPISYYILALLEFADYKNRSIVFFSDDIEYCKLHFECLPNAIFAKGNDIEQLCMMSLCNDFIISNSTFSYCGAWLSENENKKVIRPIKNIDGPLALTHDEKDFYPDTWIPFDHRGCKINLQDVTFVIPVSFDHNDRRQNLELSVCMLQQDFNTNIIIGEQGGNTFEYFSNYTKYINFNDSVFHRTKMINTMVSGCETPIFFNWDADVIIPPMQILYATELIRNGADIIYPYDGRFARVDRSKYFSKIESSLDIGILKGILFKGMVEHPENNKRELIGDVEFKQTYHKLLSVGGAIAFNKNSFIDGGMENEYMVSYAPEDLERYLRFFKLGYSGGRVKGVLYHIDHYRGPNSSTTHKNFNANETEYYKVCNMTGEQISDYVSTWDWVSKYTKSYYENITHGVSYTKNLIFNILNNNGIKTDNVLDIGCGIGQWSWNNYYGVDYNVRKNDLIIPHNRYINFNLENIKDLPKLINKNFDIVLCLEVAEHLSEGVSDDLINALTHFSDCILFSAAIPGQTGVGHINEQFQTYWVEKFGNRGFYIPKFADFNSLLFYCEDVPVWYKNNMMFFQKIPIQDSRIQNDFIHPQMYKNLLNHWTKNNI